MSKKNKFLSLLQYEASRNFIIILLNSLITMMFTIFIYCRNIFSFADGVTWKIAPEEFINEIALRNLGINNETTYTFFLEFLLVLIFSIFIWAREFYFEHKTSYRTLSLPVKRFNFILSKSLVVWLFFVMFLLGQFFSIIINWFILKVKFGSSFTIGINYLSKALFDNIRYEFISMNITNLIVMFIIIFAISLVGALVVFLKQSFGVRGIIIWILYVAFSIWIFLYIPVFKLHFFAIEFLLLYTIGLLIYIGITFLINNYLINKKVNV
ncbi:hypothetical protein ACQR24_07355 [Clostridium perfringens]